MDGGAQARGPEKEWAWRLIGAPRAKSSTRYAQSLVGSASSPCSHGKPIALVHTRGYGRV